MDSLLQDFRFALRTLLRRRTFTAVAVITIALGIGAATSIYSVVDGVLLRPLPFPQPGRLIAVYQTYPQWRKEPMLVRMWDRIPLSLPEYRDWLAAQTSFEAVAVWNVGVVLLGGAESAEQVYTVQASASLLAALGLRPELGRYFLPGEDVVGAPAVALLPHDAWVARFHRDLHVIGTTVPLDGVPYTIIGVLPPGFSLGRYEDRAVVWTPAGQDTANAKNRGNHSYQALGRLKPGVSAEQARMETGRILRGGEDPAKRGVRLTGWHPQVKAAKQPEQQPPAEEAVTTKPTPPTEEVPGKIHLQFHAVKACWISVISDGNKIPPKTLQPGQDSSYNANERFEIVLGNAGGVDLTINGKPTKPLGKPGSVLKLLIDAQSIPGLLEKTVP